MTTRAQERDLREKIARIICCFAEDNNSCGECKEALLPNYAFPDCFQNIREETDQILSLIQPLIEQARIIKAYNCPENCLHCMKPEGPWDNPSDGGCAVENELPNIPEGLTLEPDDKLPMCPKYKPDIEQAKQEVAKEILAMNKRDVGGISPEWALSDKRYKELKSRYLGDKEIPRTK